MFSLGGDVRSAELYVVMGRSPLCADSVRDPFSSPPPPPPPSPPLSTPPTPQPPPPPSPPLSTPPTPSPSPSSPPLWLLTSKVL